MKINRDEPHAFADGILKEACAKAAEVDEDREDGI